jgi:hypothetical protein
VVPKTTKQINIKIMTAFSKVQAPLIDFWGQFGLNYEPRVTNLLMGEMNRAGFQGSSFLTQNWDGKLKNKTVQLHYIPEGCEADDCGEGFTFCTSDAADSYTTKDVVLSPVCATEGLSFGDGCEFQEALEGGESWRNQLIAQKFVSLAKKTEKEVVLALFALAGEHCAGVDGVDEDGFVNLATKRYCGEGSCEYIGHELYRRLIQDAEINRYGGSPYVIGSGLIWDYFMELGFRGLDSTGVDVQRMVDIYGVEFVNSLYARDWATVDHANPFLSYDLRSAQIHELSCFAGNELEKGGLKQYTIVNPVNGLLVDVFENNTCGASGIQTSIKMRSSIGLFAKPDDLLCSAECEGVNGITKYNVVNPVLGGE